MLLGEMERTGERGIGEGGAKKGSSDCGEREVDAMLKHVKRQVF